MGGTPQMPRNTPDGLIRWMKWVEGRLSFILEKLNNVLANTGLSVPGPGVTQVDGSLVVQNGEAKSGNYVAGSAGWHLDHAGNAEFNDLTLRGGIIGNDALTNPVTPQAVYDSVQNFSLSTTLTNIRTTNVTVPSGFTKAAVQLTVRAYATNPNTTGGNNGAGGDYLYAQANINGFNGYALPTGVSGSNGSGTNVSTFAVVLTGLTPGGTISLQCAVQTGLLSWAANANNTVDLSSSISWYR
jgi:hypothetical protein